MCAFGGVNANVDDGMQMKWKHRSSSLRDALTAKSNELPVGIFETDDLEAVTVALVETSEDEVRLGVQVLTADLVAIDSILGCALDSCVLQQEQRKPIALACSSNKVGLHDLEENMGVVFFETEEIQTSILNNRSMC